MAKEVFEPFAEVQVRILCLDLNPSVVGRKMIK